MPIYELRAVHPVSVVLFSQVILPKAINMLWVRAVGQSHLLDVNQVVGRRNKVGIRIFSIVEDLRLVCGLSRVFGLWLQVGLVQHLLHKRRKQA